jgi:hypothetical protein
MTLTKGADGVLPMPGSDSNALLKDVAITHHDSPPRQCLPLGFSECVADNDLLRATSVTEWIDRSSPRRALCRGKTCAPENGCKIEEHIITSQTKKCPPWITYMPFISSQVTVT